MHVSRLATIMLVAVVAVLEISPPKAMAVASLVQVRTGFTSNNAATVTATLSPAAKPKHLLVVICAARTAVNFTTPSGFTSAKSETSAPSQEIFYKVAAGGETAVACAGGTSSRRGIQLYEFSGTATTSPLEAVNIATSTGNNASPSSGTVATTSPKTLLVASIVSQAAGTGISAWSQAFTERADMASNTRFGGADRYTTTAGNYSTTATLSASGSWRGQIAAFKLLPEGLTADIVDAAHTSIALPSVTFTAKSFDFNCQPNTATLGVTGQQLRVVNTTANAPWTLSIGATGGPTAKWSDGGANTYDFNDPTSSGCGDGADADTIAGQLTVDPSSAVITPDSSCSTTGVTAGVAHAFSQGSIDSITLAAGSALAEINCMWNITGIGLSQMLPAEPTAASYQLGLTLTLVAN